MLWQDCILPPRLFYFLKVAYLGFTEKTPQKKSSWGRSKNIAIPVWRSAAQATYHLSKAVHLVHLGKHKWSQKLWQNRGGCSLHYWLHKRWCLKDANSVFDITTRRTSFSVLNCGGFAFLSARHSGWWSRIMVLTKASHAQAYFIYWKALLNHVIFKNL